MSEHEPSEMTDEIDKAHAFLDHLEIPRSVPGNEPVECTLAARIALLDERVEHPNG